MIITNEHYPIIWQAFKEHYKISEKAVQPFTKLFSSFEYNTFDENGKEDRSYNLKNYTEFISPEEFKEIILNEKFEQLPELDLENNFHNSSSYYKLENLYRLPQSLFHRISEKFKEKNIDLVLELQKPVLIFDVKAYYAHVQEKLDRKLIRYSTYFTNQVINGQYKIDTKEKLDIFELVTSKHQTVNVKECHNSAILLLKKAIDLNYPQKKIIKWFKDFTVTNPTINPDALTTINWIKNHIKNWNLNEYFTIAEQKTLFQSSDSGITRKEVDALYYFFDLNLIKSKYPQITTSMTIETNLTNLTDYLPQLLGNTPHYVGATSKFDAPEVQLIIMFEEGHKKMYLDLVDYMIEQVCSSESVIDMKNFQKVVDSAVLNHHLNDTMSQKAVDPKKKLKM
jgi:hypothetical protein